MKKRSVPSAICCLSPRLQCLNDAESAQQWRARQWQLTLHLENFMLQPNCSSLVTTITMRTREISRAENQLCTRLKKRGSCATKRNSKGRFPICRMRSINENCMNRNCSSNKDHQPRAPNSNNIGKSNALRCDKWTKTGSGVKQRTKVSLLSNSSFTSRINKHCWSKGNAVRLPGVEATTAICKLYGWIHIQFGHYLFTLPYLPQSVVFGSLQGS
jgi:hypothetical protein